MVTAVSQFICPHLPMEPLPVDMLVDDISEALGGAIGELSEPLDLEPLGYDGHLHADVIRIPNQQEAWQLTAVFTCPACCPVKAVEDESLPLHSIMEMLKGLDKWRKEGGE